MKIVRHTAPDMRQAMRLVREQLGEEAVILSSRRTPQGVEITAAVDFDAASLETAVPLAIPGGRVPSADVVSGRSSLRDPPVAAPAPAPASLAPAAVAPTAAPAA